MTTRTRWSVAVGALGVALFAALVAYKLLAGPNLPEMVDRLGREIDAIEREGRAASSEVEEHRSTVRAMDARLQQQVAFFERQALGESDPDLRKVLNLIRLGLSQDVSRMQDAEEALRAIGRVLAGDATRVAGLRLGHDYVGRAAGRRPESRLTRHDAQEGLRLLGLLRDGLAIELQALADCKMTNKRATTALDDEREKLEKLRAYKGNPADPLQKANNDALELKIKGNEVDRKVADTVDACIQRAGRLLFREVDLIESQSVFLKAY